MTVDSIDGSGADRLTLLPKPTTPTEVRTRLLEMLRRDLVGPHPDLDADLAREVLAGTSPSTWYLTGYLGPRPKLEAPMKGDAAEEEVAELALEAQRGSEGMEQGATGSGTAADDGATERPPARSFAPSSLGLTVLLPKGTTALEARVTWGDYVVEPPLEEALILPEAREAALEAGKLPPSPKPGELQWRRLPREALLPIPLVIGLGTADDPGPGKRRSAD